MPQLSPTTKELINELIAWRNATEKKPEVVTLHVDEIASKVASFYEKLREIIDWKEEHLIRRGAITRNLKRRLVLTKNPKEIAEPLILDLIRGGHFPNDQIPETKISEVEKVLDKYLFLLEKSSLSEEKKIEFSNWLINIAACEIEEVLTASRKEKLLIDYMTKIMTERIRVQEGRIILIGGLNEEEKNTQIFIAVQRALFKLDQPIISYFLLKKKFPHWLQLSILELQEIAQQIQTIKDNLEKELNHPLKDKFYKICEKYDTPFLLLGDLLNEKDLKALTEKFNQPEVLEELIKKAYQKRLATLKKRLSRAAFYTTLSIFLTKGIFLIALEVPLAKLIHYSITPLLILVDVLGPTLLMFLLVSTITPPGKSNLRKVILETMKIVYETEKPEIYEIRIPRRRSWLMKFFIFLLYLIGATISFGAIIFFLKWLGLPPTSYVINIIFLALIASAGLSVRYKSQELTIEEKEGGVFTFLFDIIFLPLASLGRWLSNKWKKYNAVAVFFNALIDLPFQIFVEFLENWRSFLKEEKEKMH